jgi:hypothetical protein
MKVPRPFILLALGGALILIIFGCKNGDRTTDAHGPATITKNGIVLTGAKISQADAQALNAILRKYDKSLYRIRIYKEGKLENTQGRLSEDIIGRGSVREIATNAQTNLLSGWTDQIGVNDPVASILGRANRPTIPLPPPPRPLNREMLLSQSTELVRQLEPVIEKYRSGSLGQGR